MEKDGTKVKILGVSASGRHATTESAVKLALDAAKKTGYAETEYLSLADYKLLPCTGCMKCFGYQAPLDHKLGCIQWPEDEMRLVAPKVLECDALIFGSPVYVVGVTAQARMFMEKMHWFGYFSFTKWFGSLTYKPVGLITVVGSNCHETVWGHMVDWALGLGMIPVNAPPTREDGLPMTSTHAGMASCVDAYSVYAKDALMASGTRTVPPTQGIRNERSLRALGRNTVTVAQMLISGKRAMQAQGIKLPEILSFKKYSVTPKKGTFIEKMIKDGKIQYDPKKKQQ